MGSEDNPDAMADQLRETREELAKVMEANDKLKEKYDDVVDINERWRGQYEEMQGQLRQARTDGYNEGRVEAIEGHGRERVRSVTTKKYPVMKPKGFTLGRDNFRTYLAGFKIFVNACAIPREDIVDLLMTYLGPKAQRRVETLRLTSCDKEDVEECYEKIANVLSEVHSKAEFRRKLFDTRQAEGETISDFASRVMELADQAYKTPEEENIKNTMALDVFTAGVARDEIGIELIKEDVSDFDTALKRAMKLDGILASREPKVKGSDDTLFQVMDEGEEEGLRGSQSQAQGNKAPCYTCGQPGHYSRDCRIPPSCFQCGKTGHIARECNQRPRGDRSGRWGQSYGRRDRSNSSSGMRCYSCNQVGHRADQCFTCYKCGKQGHKSNACRGLQPNSGGHEKVQARLQTLRMRGRNSGPLN